ncbi:hypothetical protein EVAR_62138_1 [Eumeta japonica]|uniref:Uncharacterized protein n=1 Tax=Eumeta variegata TaxID=151549 RepID=A0A4C1ZIH6_EUMVA|nr:hypothetical protein EVAR_62138_1 [Eumeta japonica]
MHRSCAPAKEIREMRFSTPYLRFVAGHEPRRRDPYVIHSTQPLYRRHFPGSPSRSHSSPNRRKDLNQGITDRGRHSPAYGPLESTLSRLTQTLSLDWRK